MSRAQLKVQTVRKIRTDIPYMTERRKPIPGKEEVEQAIAQSKSISQVLERLGMSVNTGGYRRIEGIAREYELYEHLPKYGQREAAFNSAAKRRLSNEEFFIEGAFRTGRDLKKRLLEGGMPHRCAKCSLPPMWQGEPISLQVDHISGDKYDNRIENLRLLCPNCHSQTETFAGRANIKYHFCECGQKISKGATRCQTHAAIASHESGAVRGFASVSRIDWEEIDVIVAKIETMGYLAYGREIGTSDNAIRKHLRVRGVSPLPKRIV